MIYGLLRIINASDPFNVLDDVFFNKKINRFDTANCYGNSEKIFGEWQDNYSLGEFLFITRIMWNAHPLVHIKYLHQLQNLYFALTGQELIYNQSIKPQSK